MSNVISLRVSKELKCGLTDIMRENSISQSEAIRFLYDYYRKSSGAIPPKKKQQLIKFSTDMDTLLNYLGLSCDVTEARVLMEEMRKCLI